MAFKKIVLALSLTASLCVSFGAAAAQNVNSGSCYSRTHTQQWQPSGSGRQLTVVIDQTVVLPDALQHDVWNKVASFIAPGDEVKLYTFSALVPGQYMQLVADSYLDPLPAASSRGDIPMDDLSDLDDCLSQQKSQFIETWGRSLVKAMQDSKSDIPKSEIMHSLKSIGDDLKVAPAHQRIIFLVSDMLENSDVASFYQHNQIRRLNVPLVLSNVRKQDLFADLDGANVYVLGAGLMTSTDSHYIGGKTLDSLQSFWQQWFAQSNAKLVAFGTPALNQPL